LLLVLVLLMPLLLALLLLALRILLLDDNTLESHQESLLLCETRLPFSRSSFWKAPSLTHLSYPASSLCLRMSEVPAKALVRQREAHALVRQHAWGKRAPALEAFLGAGPDTLCGGSSSGSLDA
jgi:hypothetical protein